MDKPAKEKYCPEIVLEYPIININGKTSPLILTFRSMLLLEHQYSKGFIEIIEDIRKYKKPSIIISLAYQMIDKSSGITLAELIEASQLRFSEILTGVQQAIELCLPIKYGDSNDITDDNSVEEETTGGIPYNKLLYFALNVLHLTKEQFLNETYKTISGLLEVHNSIYSIDEEDEVIDLSELDNFF